MNIVIAGGSGFLGRPLTDALVRDGHDVVLLTRKPASERPAPPRVRAVVWTPDGQSGPWAAAIDGADTVINLSGESIAGGRWTADRKRRIVESRVLATRSLTTAIRQAAHPPALFVSGSAVGYYGPLGDEVVTEARPAGADFLADTCVRWEDAAKQIDPARTRLACIRTGLVLERDGGALPQMMAPFRFGAGGPVGSGRQYLPWIHRRDWIDLVRFVMHTPAASGAVNATAPNPVTSAEFAAALGRVMHRPAFMPAPAFALKLLLGGEMATALLLSGQRVVPARAEQLGFTFSFKNVEDALRSILSNR
jgi:uncharacterized protein (TIGR01777 family)